MTQSKCLKMASRLISSADAYSLLKSTFATVKDSRRSCSSWAGEADEKYPPGEEVTVYVNPNNPYECNSLN